MDESREFDQASAPPWENPELLTEAPPLEGAYGLWSAEGKHEDFETREELADAVIEAKEDIAFGWEPE